MKKNRDAGGEVEETVFNNKGEQIIDRFVMVKQHIS